MEDNIVKYQNRMRQSLKDKNIYRDFTNQEIQYFTAKNVNKDKYYFKFLQKLMEVADKSYIKIKMQPEKLIDNPKFFSIAKTNYEICIAENYRVETAKKRLIKLEKLIV